MEFFIRGRKREQVAKVGVGVNALAVGGQLVCNELAVHPGSRGVMKGVEASEQFIKQVHFRLRKVCHFKSLC